MSPQNGKPFNSSITVSPSFTICSLVYNIPSFQVANCTPPTFPFAIDDYQNIYDGYVAKSTDEGPMLCGGGSDPSACYLLENYNTWKKEAKGMSTPRKQAAAVEMDAGWWVTGQF